MSRPGLPTALPLAFVAAVLAGLAIIGLTESSVEREVKGVLGYSTGCQPMIDVGSAWQPGPALATPTDEPRGVALDGSVYLLGGVTGIEPLESGDVVVNEVATVTRFDPATGRYRDVKPMPEPGNHIGTVSHEGALYVLGGFAPRLDRPAKGRFSRYLVAQRRWEELPPMPRPRGAMAVGVIDDRIIVAGGASAGRATRRVDAYDLETGRWSRLADMPTAREHVAGAVVDGSLYVLGGRDARTDALDTAASYDPRTDRWERLPPMPVAAGGLDAAAVGGAVIGVGGGNDRAGTVTAAVQRFDIRTGRWSRLPDLRTPRHGHATAVAGDRLWVFGGSPCAYFAATDLVEWLALDEIPQPSARASIRR